MICKDCIHYPVCKAISNDTTACNHFNDKSRIVELPCKLGDTVWFVRNGKILETIVDKIVLKHRGLHIKLGCNAMYETSCNSIWKTVFLTREEAEEALRKEREK